ncbi:MAG: methyltransferase [Candidatus Hydrogenedentes bacterium]|nr:methyltransferase [Candidatus Hydrogenedentota bacterium]
MKDLKQLREWTGKISSIASGYKMSQILYTALNAGVFDLLDVPQPASYIAAKLGWSERGTQMLLDGLLVLELVTKTDDCYKNTEAAAVCLMQTGDAYQGHILRHNQNSCNDWMALPDRIRTGTCGSAGENRSGEVLRDFILGMNDIAKISAYEVLQDIDISSYRHMLDLAGGPATYSIAFLEKNSKLHATLFDKPSVIEIAQEQVNAANLENRFNYIAGDCMNDSLGSGYDLVFMSNIIHSFSAEENKNLVKHAYEALIPGGTILIKDFIMENDRSGPAFGLIFALHMLVLTPAGGTYTYDEIKDWTDTAGFINGTFFSLTPQTRMWIAHKPK